MKMASLFSDEEIVAGSRMAFAFLNIYFAVRLVFVGSISGRPAGTSVSVELRLEHHQCVA
jgi:hypothetical protein